MAPFGHGAETFMDSWVMGPLLIGRFQFNPSMFLESTRSRPGVNIHLRWAPTAPYGRGDIMHLDNWVIEQPQIILLQRIFRVWLESLASLPAINIPWLSIITKRYGRGVIIAMVKLVTARFRIK